MGAAAILALIVNLAPTAINLGELLAAAIHRHSELSKKADRSDVENQELDVLQAVIDTLQDRISARADAAKARQATSDGS